MVLPPDDDNAIPKPMTVSPTEVSVVHNDIKAESSEGKVSTRVGSECYKCQDMVFSNAHMFLQAYMFIFLLII